tara:strand:+ start:7385 stop:7582 length:198 start_codon:yes stop_codon:yes gene_type:complete
LIKAESNISNLNFVDERQLVMLTPTQCRISHGQRHETLVDDPREWFDLCTSKVFIIQSSMSIPKQ